MKITPELEAVARAICKANLISTNQPTDDETIGSYWRSFIFEARAALTAIREPTDGMAHAALDTGCCGEPIPGKSDHEVAATINRAVMDYILGGER